MKYLELAWRVRFEPVVVAESTTLRWVVWGHGPIWNTVFTTKSEQQANWFEALPAVSLELMEAAGLSEDTCVLDGGGGDSRLVDALARAGSTAWPCSTSRAPPCSALRGDWAPRRDPNLDRSGRSRRVVAEADGHLARPRRLSLPDGTRRSGSLASVEHEGATRHPVDLAHGGWAFHHFTVGHR